MPFEELEKALTEQITNLRPAPAAPEEPVEFDAVYLDGTEPGNRKWLELIRERIKTAKSFEIHCWNEETEWIELALKYASRDGGYTRVVRAGPRRGDAAEMAIVELIGFEPKPEDDKKTKKAAKKAEKTEEAEAPKAEKAAAAE